MKTIRYLILPLLVFSAIVWILANVKIWKEEFEAFSHLLSNAILVKFVFMVVVPMSLILLSKELKAHSGIYFGEERSSLLTAWTCFYLLGPASMTFMVIGMMGWSFKDWSGSLLLTAVFLVVLYFIPKITYKLPTFEESEKHSLKGISILILLSLVTVCWSFFVSEEKPIPFKLFYFFFIVAVGEELLFRGYLQSSFNLFFGKSFKVGDVEFGWGLILAALLFGLIHSLVTDPIAWTWMLFTFVGGLILGFVREKDGSLLAPIALHALMDFPLVFVG